jgi:hypothetical protein
MAHEILNVCYSRPVAADYSASQYRFMRVNSSGQWARAGDGEDADAVLQNDPDAANKAGSGALPGCVTKIESGGTITAGGLVASDSVGRAVDVVSGDYILGRAVEGSSSAGDYVTLLFTPGHATY